MNSSLSLDQSKVWQKIDFCTCSFIRSQRSQRAKLVKRAIGTWQPFLELPFNQKIFLDDRSPSCAGIQLLLETSCSQLFNEIHYTTFEHPSHSNFGIYVSYMKGKSEYLFHLDDDVQIQGSQEECKKWIEHTLEILESDPNILGVNLLSLDNREGYKSWRPHIPYSINPSQDEPLFAHPFQYFGTCASIIRHSLLSKVTLEEMLIWGQKQPETWEKLVTLNPSSFLVSTKPTPFNLDEKAWQFSTFRLSAFERFRKRKKWQTLKQYFT